MTLAARESAILFDVVVKLCEGERAQIRVYSAETAEGKPKGFRKVDGC
jgi:hypothetical protein